MYQILFYKKKTTLFYKKKEKRYKKAFEYGLKISYLNYSNTVSKIIKIIPSQKKNSFRRNFGKKVATLGRIGGRTVGPQSYSKRIMSRVSSNRHVWRQEFYSATFTFAGGALAPILAGWNPLDLHLQRQPWLISRSPS